MKKIELNKNYQAGYAENVEDLKKYAEEDLEMDIKDMSTIFKQERTNWTVYFLLNEEEKAELIVLIHANYGDAQIVEIKKKNGEILKNTKEEQSMIEALEELLDYLQIRLETDDLMHVPNLQRKKYKDHLQID